MRKISVDEFMFLEAFQRDEDFEHYPQSTYLDLKIGEILWIFDDDHDAEMLAGIEPEENAALREKVETASEIYLEIRGRDHGEHHDILREFLNSNWTDDEELRAKVRDAYSSSIGGWKEEVDDQNVLNAYYDFRDRKIKELAEEFLHENDIQPIWR
jgi:hypothetical protein